MIRSILFCPICKSAIGEWGEPNGITREQALKAGYSYLDEPGPNHFSERLNYAEIELKQDPNAQIVLMRCPKCTKLLQEAAAALSGNEDAET